jgi:Zn/Cd-binding protein ZinT
MNFITRKLAKSFSSTCYLSKISDSEYTLTTVIPILTHVQKIKIGEEIVQNTMDGRKIKNTFKIDGNQLIEQQTEDNRKVTIVRKFFDSEMHGIMKLNDITSTSINVLVE